MAESLTSINGVLFRKSDCGGEGLGTATVCARYDRFADNVCYELVAQVSSACAGFDEPEREACAQEARQEEHDLEGIVATLKFDKSRSAVDPRTPLSPTIIYTPPLGYTPYTLHDGQVALSFEYPDDPSWAFTDNQYEHALVGRIAVGGAQVNSRKFIAISLNPGVDVFQFEGEQKFIQFVENNRFGQGYALNGDPRLPEMPSGVWRVSAGSGVSGYFAMNYGLMGRVNGTMALNVSVCHTYSCTVSSPLRILIEFLDVNSEITKRFLSTLRVDMPGESHSIAADEKLR